MINDMDSATTTEFASLCASIAKDADFTKSSWKHLENTFKIVGTARDNLDTRTKIHEVRSRTNNRIRTASIYLRRLAVVAKQGEKQQQLQAEKLTSEFKNVIEMYLSSQKQIAAKMKNNLLSNASKRNGIFCVSYNQMNPEDQLQQEEMIKRNSEFELQEIDKREKDLKQIESNISDIREIMRDLSALVNEQAEPIANIEENVRGVVEVIEAGKSDLENAEQSRTKCNRNALILLVIAVLIGLIVIGVGVVVFQLKK